jgi:hypothetical protein
MREEVSPEVVVTQSSWTGLRKVHNNNSQHRHARKKLPAMCTSNGSREGSHPAEAEDLPAPARHGCRPGGVQTTDDPVDSRQKTGRHNNGHNTGATQAGASTHMH